MSNQPQNFSDTTPAAPATGLNVVWQATAPGTISAIRDISAYVPFATNSTVGLVKPDGTTISLNLTTGAISVKVPPLDTPAVAHEWLDSYDAATGSFGQSQPEFADILGIASYGQIPVFPYTAQTANYAVQPLDYQIECTANSFTVTLPTAVGVAGRVYSIKNTGTGTITVATTSAQTIDGQLTQTLSQWSNMVVMSNGIGWLIL